MDILLKKLASGFLKLKKKNNLHNSAIYKQI